MYCKSGRQLADQDFVNLLTDRFGMGLVGALGFYRRFSIGFEMPVIAVNRRPSSIDNVNVNPLSNIDGFSLGVLRLAPKLGLLVG